jgi:site-specific DNA-methyltransferase (adenine-specific)
MDNTLYYGDNLDVLRRYIKNESVDLVYLDPPFKSNQDYNVLFAEQDGQRAAAQIKAFEDTWRWDQAAAAAYEEMVTRGGKVSQVMQAFYTFLGGNDMMAYLAMMAPRLVELHRVLKPTGSIYLHCDPTASHYLKLLMDAIFGIDCFRNDITWKRQTSGSSKAVAKRFGSDHDVLLFYSKGREFLFRQVWMDYPEHEIEKRFKKSDKRGRYKDAELATYSKETLQRLKKEGRLIVTNGGKYRYKIYLDEIKGVLADDVWSDIPPINSQAAERLGYPTQKPEALLERIIKASSNVGDVVLDPFCGCGTAIAVAQKLNRHWIGIDITHLAITLIKKRLADQFGAKAKLEMRNEKLEKKKKVPPPALPQAEGNAELKYAVIGEPVSLDDAKALAEQDKYQFQWWALGLVNARPVEQKKGADQGIDGRRYFIDGKDRHTEQIIISVKGGNVNAAQVRDLRGVIEREKAAIGVFITLEEPTKPMKKEAADAGFYHSDWRDTKHPRLQIVTIEELLNGKALDLPPLVQADPTFKTAPKSKRSGKKNEALDLE